jgi:hypothetical protein
MDVANIEHVSAYQAISKQESAITVSTSPLDGGGWTVRVKFPKKAPLGDRQKLLNWMMAYREQIKRQYPLWDVSFRSGENVYWLMIKPANCQNDLKRLAREKANNLFEFVMSSYAGE